MFMFIWHCQYFRCGVCGYIIITVHHFMHHNCIEKINKNAQKASSNLLHSTKLILLVQKDVFFAHFCWILTQSGNDVKFITIHEKMCWNHYLTFTYTWIIDLWHHLTAYGNKLTAKNLTLLVFHRFLRCPILPA